MVGSLESGPFAAIIVGGAACISLLVAAVVCVRARHRKRWKMLQEDFHKNSVRGCEQTSDTRGQPASAAHTRPARSVGGRSGSMVRTGDGGEVRARSATARA